ncbi:MAG: YgfZ/GcvT domain-containing protein [Acidimicrobiales bacterium]
MSDLEADYRHLRDDVGAFDLPRDFVRVAGPDAAAYLQGQCSQELEPLAVGSAADTLVLAPDGKIEALARVVRVAEDAFHLDVDGGHGAALLARLARFKLRSKLDLEPIDWSCLALRGPAAAGAAGSGAALVVPVDWSGWSGVDLLGPTGSVGAPPGVTRCSEAAWEAARIESGVPVMGRELTEGVIPAEAGVVERAVSFTKGCFTGQELVARIDSRGASVPHRLRGLVVEAEADPATLGGRALFVEGKDKTVGRVTSAARCPGIGAVGALAYVHRSVELPGPVRLGPAGPMAAVRELPLV